MDNKEMKLDGNYIKEDNKGALEIDLWELVIYFLSKWYWFVFSGILVGLVVFLVTTFMIAPKYQASITLNVENRREGVISDNISSNDISAAESLAETYRVILSSNSVREAVSEAFGSDVISRDALKRMVSITSISNTQILEIKVTHEVPSMAYSIARTYEWVGPEMIKKLTNWGTAYVVDHAIMPKSPSSPNVERDTVIGFIMGAVLCAIVLVIIKFSDHRIYCVEDIEDAINVTVIGQLPKCIIDENAEDSYHSVKKREVI